MRQSWLRLPIFIAILLLLSTSTLTNAQQQTDPPPDPGATMRALTAAFNAGETEEGMSYYADDAVFIALPPPPETTGVFAGKDAITDLKTQLSARNGYAEFIDMQVNGDRVNWTVWFTEDVFRGFGVYPILFSGTAVIRDGVVHSESWIMSEESSAMIDRALAEEQMKAMIRRGYDEMWSQGNMELVDELHHPDFFDRHTGQTGTEAIHFIVGRFRESFPDMQVTYDNMVAEGDLVVTEVTFDLGAYQGGMEDLFGIPDLAIGTVITRTGIDYARFQDGKIIEAWGTHDELGWFQQFGFELVPPTE